MTPADLAIDSAIHFEGVKHAYRQTKDGVVISFVVHPHDVPKGLADAPLGSRYIVALVQVGDDEQPVRQPAKEKKVSPAAPQPTTHPPAAAKRGKMDWCQLQPASQCGIRCDDPVFQAFLREECDQPYVDSSEQAAEYIRGYCAIKSRSELSTDHRKRMLWHQLDSQFIAWKAMEQA